MTSERRHRSAITAILSALIMLFAVRHAAACQCPPTTLSAAEAAKYEIIFRGKVERVTPCGDRPGEAVFRVAELYKGNATETFTVQFGCDDPCAVGFHETEEWIIYSRYRQVNLARMDWCSRSRRFFENENHDFYKVNYGNDYMEEVLFLRENLGLHRLLHENDPYSGNRNRLPDNRESILLVVCSIAGIVLFYFLFRKFFR